MEGKIKSCLDAQPNLSKISLAEILYVQSGLEVVDFLSKTNNVHYLKESNTTQSQVVGHSVPHQDLILDL